MHGKILRIASNDLYGNATDKKVVVFVCFNHLKYMNKYIIFSYLGEYNEKRLYYGSVHEKNKSLVIFGVRDKEIQYIDKFRMQYESGKIDNEEYQIIDIDKMEKVEIVSSNSIEYDKLQELEDMSIKKEIVSDNEEVRRKPIFLYFLLIILILLGVGITYLYLRPEDFVIKNKKLECTTDGYNVEIGMKFLRTEEVLFDRNVKVDKIFVNDKYVFETEEEYLEFKNNGKENEYFNIDGTFKYNDQELTLLISYKDNSIIEEYDDMKDYLSKEGYSCIEGYYEE